MSGDAAPLDLAGAIDVIEETYEFMLAYAAQGSVNDTDTSSAGIRAYLERSQQALGVIAVGEAFRSRSAEISGCDAPGRCQGRRRNRPGAGRDAISSQLIDNLNASVHLRTLLTDIFLLDEALAITPP